MSLRTAVFAIHICPVTPRYCTRNTLLAFRDRVSTHQHAFLYRSISHPSSPGASTAGFSIIESRIPDRAEVPRSTTVRSECSGPLSTVLLCFSSSDAWGCVVLGQPTIDPDVPALVTGQTPESFYAIQLRAPTSHPCRFLWHTHS